MKQLVFTLSFLCAVVYGSTTNAQRYNYRAIGINKTPVSNEKISVSTTIIEKKEALPAILLAAIPAAIGVGTSFAKTALDKKAQSYASSYTGSLTAKDLCFFDGAFKPFLLNIIRNTFETNGRATNTASNISLETVTDGSLFRFKLKSLILNASKARVRKAARATGKTVDLNIEIQVNVVYRGDWKLDSVSPTKKVERYGLKSAVLGTSSITIAGVEPGGTFTVADDSDNSLYSDWFQMIPQPSLEGELAARLDGKHEKQECWATVKVTVKEANPYGVNATTMAEFFGGSQESLTDFLKSFVPEKKE